MRERILEEIERRRGKYLDILEKTDAEHIQHQTTGAAIELDHLAKWIKSQPIPEASELVREVRDQLAQEDNAIHTPVGQQMSRLADALETVTAERDALEGVAEAASADVQARLIEVAPNIFETQSHEHEQVRFALLNWRTKYPREG